MPIIQKTIPKGYQAFTNLIYDTFDKKYFVKRTKKMLFFNKESLSLLITKILDIDKSEKILLKNEKRILDLIEKFVAKKTQEIQLKDYNKMVDLSFKALKERVQNIKSCLEKNMKAKKLHFSKIDSEYFLALDNILKQLDIVSEEIKNKDYFANNSKELIKKLQMISKNLNNLVYSILEEDFDSIKNISHDILYNDKIEFNITEKLVA